MRPVIIPCDDYVSVSRRAAEYVHGFLQHDRTALIALPTGGSPRLMYKLLATRLRGRGSRLRGISFVNLDEYVGVPKDHPGSFAYQIYDSFTRWLPLEEGAVRLLDGAAADLASECQQHEGWIEQHGGLELAILGIGVNGHIAFNEPGTAFDSRTHVARLAASTRSRITNGSRGVPSQAVTLGIGTILDARKILLMASGGDKAASLQRAFRSPASTDTPASALQQHPDVTLIADAAALRGLTET